MVKDIGIEKASSAVKPIYTVISNPRANFIFKGINTHNHGAHMP